MSAKQIFACSPLGMGFPRYHPQMLPCGFVFNSAHHDCAYVRKVLRIKPKLCGKRWRNPLRKSGGIWFIFIFSTHSMVPGPKICWKNLRKKALAIAGSFWGCVVCLACLTGSSQQAFMVDTLIILFFTVKLVLFLGTVLAYSCWPSPNIDSGFLTLSNGLIYICSGLDKEKRKMSLRFFPRCLIPGFITESLNSATSWCKPMKMHKSSLYGFWFLVFYDKWDSAVGDMTQGKRKVLGKVWLKPPQWAFISVLRLGS